MTNTEVFLQQLIYGLSNGMIIALVALGYTMVYGIVELINFAHGDVFTLGGFLTLTIVGVLGAAAIIEPGALGESSHWLLLLGLVIAAGVFCGGLNLAINRIVYKPLRSAPKLTQLVAAIGKVVTPAAFGEYMQFHFRKLYKPAYRPVGFCYAVRRPDHFPEVRCCGVWCLMVSDGV